MKIRQLEGKVAIVTGSSRGIGKAIAMELARQGASVVLNGRNQERLSRAEEEIKTIHDRISAVCCDVSTTDGGKLLITEALRRFGKLDILVNNVGISMRGNMADLNPEVFKLIFESNISGTASPTIAAIPGLRATRGSIVFISSVAGIRGLPNLSAYCSSKMALKALAESLRIEEAGNGIHIGLVYVGYTENDPGKETIAADGSKVVLQPRSGSILQTKERVARAVVRNIIRRKYITVLSLPGKLLSLVQPLSPRLVEWLILHHQEQFRRRNK